MRTLQLAHGGRRRTDNEQKKPFIKHMSSEIDAEANAIQQLSDVALVRNAVVLEQQVADEVERELQSL